MLFSECIFFFDNIKLTLSSGGCLIVVSVLGFQDESGKTQQAWTPNTLQYSWGRAWSKGPCYRSFKGTLKERRERSSYVFKVVSLVVISLTRVFLIAPVQVRGLSIHINTCSGSHVCGMILGTLVKPSTPKVVPFIFLPNVWTLNFILRGLSFIWTPTS